MTRFARTQLAMSIVNAAMFLLALIPFGFSWLTALTLFGGATVVMLLLVAGTSVVWPRAEYSAHERRRTYFYLLATPWLLVSLVALRAALHSLDLCSWTACTPAPWATQLAVAQHKARSYRRDLVLTSISATPKATRSANDPITTDVSFDFVAPSGEALLVTLDEQHPRTSVRAIDFTTGSPLPPTDIQPALRFVTVSPASAFGVAHHEAQQFLQAQAHQAVPQASLVVGVDVPARFNMPAAWSLLYFGNKGDETQILQVWVDPQTGLVLGSAMH